MKDVPKAIEAVWKIESTRLIAAIARVTHDIGIAEELAQRGLTNVAPDKHFEDMNCVAKVCRLALTHSEKR